jgi:hypothetical protein
MRLVLRDVKLLVYQWSWKWTHLETKLIPISVVCTFFVCWIFRQQPAGTPVTVRMNTRARMVYKFWLSPKRFSLRARSSKTDLTSCTSRPFDPCRTSLTVDVIWRPSIYTKVKKWSCYAWPSLIHIYLSNLLQVEIEREWETIARVKSVFFIDDDTCYLYNLNRR